MVYWGIIKIKCSSSIEIYGNPIMFDNLEKLAKKEKAKNYIMSEEFVFFYILIL